MSYIITILAAAVILTLMVLLISAKPRLSKLVTISALIVAVVGGLLVYNYGYIDVGENMLLAILKATLAVGGAFVGADDYSALPDSPALQSVPMQILCVFIRICALYVTASTVITAIGTGALRRLRLWISRREQLNLIYGNAPDAPDFACRLLEEKQGAVVFVADQPGEDFAGAVTRAGCVLRTDTHALKPDKSFLRSMGLLSKKRQVTLYAMDADPSANIIYARTLLASLQQANANPENLHLVIFAREDSAVSTLQVTEDHYGYGFVTAVNAPQLAARLLTLEYPPCDTIHFDDQGRATEDFEALLIGFGQVGQAVLKQLVMNGQFVGSRFHAAVFSPDCHSADGSFADRCKGLYNQYSIDFYEADGRSRQLYDYLRNRGDKLKYVAICTGSAKQNREIGEDLTTHFQNAGLHIPIYLCDQTGVQLVVGDGTLQTHPLMCPEVLSTHSLDNRAMVLNHRYNSPTDRSALECWMACDYFSRQSCRASADFIPAMIRAAGAQAETWELTAAQLENLSITEHLRWCAFHYCMGFSPMSQEEFSARAETYLQQKQAGQKPLRIGKNLPGRTHACLIDWEELDALSEKEAQVTGNYVNYKAMDTDNVLAIPQLLKES